MVSFSILPVVSALPSQAPFPDVTFAIFNEFIQENFSSEVSLTTVLMVLFTLTNNPTLLSLHARQQNPAVQGENRVQTSGWIKALARGINERLGSQMHTLQGDENQSDTTVSEQVLISSLGKKLDGLAKLLGLYPYSAKGKFQGKLKPVSHVEIQPLHIICPDSVECEDMSCKPCSLHQITKTRDIPMVTLVKGLDIYNNVPVLTGECFQCGTLYSADHERVSEVISQEEIRYRKVYLNSAKYLKIGQSLWVDRIFSNAVVNGMYSFHASASAYMEYWNNSFGMLNQMKPLSLSRRHIWQAFIQESTRAIAASAQVNLELNDGLAIDEVAMEAFNILGENGLIRAADQHSCSECTHRYKATSDITNADPAAVVGVDENRVVPPLHTIDHGVGSQNIAQPGNVQIEQTAENEPAFVRLVVMDGIVMGPQHCAFPHCTSDLANSRGGVFCSHHDIQYGARCRVHGCLTPKIAGMQACFQHREEWLKHQFNHSSAVLTGVRRMLRQPGENVPWQPTRERVSQPHDNPTSEINVSRNYFSAGRFYCVETICAPCGVVIAWTKFDKSESPTQILNFLESVYPTEESRPDYVCIDKACLVLRSSIANGSWDTTWKKTTRFIVDSYHYINHRADDYLCRKWCNPAPLNGSAPNLVLAATNSQGQTYYKRAFNTQVYMQSKRELLFANGQ
jgi:hypothetical protein